MCCGDLECKAPGEMASSTSSWGGIMPVQVRRAVLCGGARLLGRRVAMSVDLETPLLLMRCLYGLPAPVRHPAPARQRTSVSHSPRVVD